jgi:hypothetical protein
LVVECLSKSKTSMLSSVGSQTKDYMELESASLAKSSATHWNEKVDQDKSSAGLECPVILEKRAGL